MERKNELNIKYKLQKAMLMKKAYAYICMYNLLLVNKWIENLAFT